MNKNMTFCEQCRDDVLYIEKDEIMEANLKGEIIDMLVKDHFVRNVIVKYLLVI